jgi:peptidoglycan/LPS O-acetylase OafA/YrhL
VTGPSPGGKPLLCARMTPASLQKVPTSDGRNRFELIDAMRGLAALSVLVYHVTFFFGPPGGAVDYLTGRITGEPYPGVVVFFVISGFVLYRPFAEARFLGTAPPSLAPYFVRRVARIVPAYWVALTVVAVMLGLHYVFTPGGVVRYYGFLQIYQPFYPALGIGPAWTLCVEMTFYAALPLLALSVRRLAARQTFLRAELMHCGALVIGSLAWQLLIFHLRPPGWWELSLLYVLPGTLALFATGIALAALSVALQHRASRPRWLEVSSRLPWVSWIVAIALLYSVGRASNLASTHFEAWWVLTGALKAGSAFFLLLPLVFGSGHRDAMRRALGSRPLLFLGTISYGVYIWHYPLLLKLGPHLVEHGELFADIALTMVTAAVASLSFYLVERPAQRLARRWLTTRRTKAAVESSSDAIAVNAPGAAQ